MSGWRSQSRWTGSSRTPPFQPPSFYAAAAGVPYHSSTTAPSSNQASSNTYPTTPIADDSDSAKEHTAGPRSRRRRSVSLSRALLPGGNRQEKEKSKHQDSKSQMMDIPFLETSLIPSLRDTIDKMTHPPRKDLRDPIEAQPYPQDHADEYAPTTSNFGKVKGNLLSTGPYHSNGHSPVSLAGSSSAASPHTANNPKVGSGLRTPQVTTPRSAYSTPKPQFVSDDVGSPAQGNIGLASSTRSAMKSPYLTPKLPSPNPPPDTTSPLLVQSLRTTRNMVSSSPAIPTATTPSTSHLRTSKIKSPSKPVEDYTLIKPGGKHIASRDKYKKGSPIVPPAPMSQTSRSHLPVSNGTVDSASETERQYGRSLVSGKLVVANAHVEASSSDSDSGYQARSPGQVPSRLRTPKALRSSLLERIGRSPRDIPLATSPAESANDERIRRADTSRYTPATQTVGLGLGLYPEKQQRFHYDSQDDDERSVYDDEDTLDTPEDVRLHQLAHLSSKRLEYVDDEDSSYEASDHERIDHFHDRYQRQQALLGLVDGLQTDFELRAEHAYHAPSDDDGQYQVQDVIAFSGSTDFANESQLHNQGLGRHTDNRHLREAHRHSKSRDRRDPPVQSSQIFQSDPSRASALSKQDNRRDSRLVPRPSSRQDHRERELIQSKQDTRPSTSRPTSSKSKSRHRKSMSLDKLTEKTQNPNHDSRPAQRTSERRRDSQRMSGNPRSDGHQTSDVVMREREGFGIPASLSYGGIGTSPEVSMEGPELPREYLVRSASENSVSSVEELTNARRGSVPAAEDKWPNPGSGLSSGAEALFRHLATGTQDSRYNKRDLGHCDSKTRGKSSKSCSTKRRSSSVPSRGMSGASFMPNPWSPSGSHDSQEHVLELGHQSEYPATSWQALMRPSTYRALLTKHGPIEMQRQELLYEQYLHQQEFTKRLRSTVSIFIVPLRRKHSKSWVAGVPVQASRLFDWLEDILNLHTGLAETFETLSHAWSTGVILHVAQSFRNLVPRLEVYQPYLVRVNEVRALLMQKSNIGGEFLEFVKLRERHVDCGGWTLADLLFQPVERLGEFVTAVQRLLALTPRAHPDHLASLSLYHSTQMIFYVLHEVKEREEEYQFIKDIASRINDLLPSVQLAKRERRLLWHGEVACVFREDPTQATPLSVPLQSRDDRRRESSDQARAGSSRWQRSQYSSPNPSTPAIVLSPCPDVYDSKKQHNQRERRASNTKSRTNRQSAVHCFAFTDVLILAEPLSGSAGPEQRWKLYNDAGMSRVLGVTGDKEIMLDLLPLNPSDLQTGVIPDGNSTEVAQLTLFVSDRTARNKLASALRQCYAYTLRSLSFPTHSGHYLPHGPHVDLEHDTQQSVMAILNTGLPLPKSPSVQLSDMERLRSASTGNESDQEREERGWWALRFQQVLKEMQRQDPMVSLDFIDKVPT